MTAADRPVKKLFQALVKRGRWGWDVTWRPRWPQVQRALDRVDGRTRGVVVLEVSPGTSLEVMRTADLFLVTNQREEGKGGVLVSLDWSDRPERLLFRWSNDVFSWPPRCGVSKELALRAARGFFETGRGDSELSWELVTPEVVEDYPPRVQ